MRLLDNNPESIGIMRLSAIGDVCHAVSAVQAIQNQYPEAKITWIIGKVEALLVGDLPGIEFIVFDKKLGFKAYRNLRQQLKGRQFDILLHMQLALRANIAARLIPAKIKLGFHKQRAKELHSLAVNHHIQHEIGMHVLEGFRDFARAIGVEDTGPQWNIPIAEADLAWAKQHTPLSKDHRTYMVISPAASKPERNWLTDRYAAIADYCHSKGIQVVITGTANNRDISLSHDIVRQCEHPVIDLTGKTNLKQLLAVLKYAQFVIAPDSGPAHMAVTQSTPVIGLYAHSNPKRTGPYLYLDYVADAYTANATQALNLSAENLPWGYRLKGKDLMNHITVHQVQCLIDKLLQHINT